MPARVTTLEGTPGKRDDAKRHDVREHLLPQLRQQDGFEGFILLGDAHSGKVLGVVLWESEEAADRMRGESAHATGARIAGEERYEVRVFEVSR